MTEGERIDAGALYRAHAGFVAGFLVRMGARQTDVADLVQEVFLVAHRRGGFVAGAARPTTWLAEIAIRVLSTHRRTKRRKPSEPMGEKMDEMTSTLAATEAQVSARRSLERVQQCLDELSEEHRAVFVLYELEGEPCSAIGAALGVPVGTIHSRLHHARAKFQDAWSRLVERKAT